MTGNTKHKGIVPSPSKSPMARPTDREDDSLLSSALKNGLIALAAFAVTGAILIFGATAAAYATPDPMSLVPALSLAALLLSAFAGGFVSSKKTMEAPLLCGIVTGGMITLFSILLSLILRELPTSGFEFWQSAALHSATVIFSVLGAFAGNVRKKKKSGKRRFG